MTDKNIYRFEVYNQPYEFEIPEDRTISDSDRRAFDLFYRTLGEYHGLPEQHIAALELIPEIKSLPLFVAAMAAMITSIAYQHGNAYDKSLMKEATLWLEQAEELAPEEKAVLQAALYLYRAREKYEQAQSVLKLAESLYPDDIDFHLAKLELLGRTGTARQFKRAVHAFEKKWQENTNNDVAIRAIQKQFLFKTAYAFYSYQEWAEAIKQYKKYLQIAPTHPWAWHNLSLAQLDSKRLLAAAYSNRKALDLMEFNAALEVKKTINQQLIISGIAILAIIGLAVGQIIFG